MTYSNWRRRKRRRERKGLSKTKDKLLHFPQQNWSNFVLRRINISLSCPVITVQTLCEILLSPILETGTKPLLDRIATIPRDNYTHEACVIV